MKYYIALIAIAVAVTQCGCGVVQNLRQDCHGDAFCEYVLGRDQTQTDKQQDAANAQRYNQLNFALNQTIAEFRQQSFLTLSDLAALQNFANSLQMQLVQVAAQQAPIDLVDPCGHGPGYDEVLVRVSPGRLFAYFEQGGNRFLTELVPGVYQTTDAQRCVFTVHSNGAVTWY